MIYAFGVLRNGYYIIFAVRQIYHTALPYIISPTAIYHFCISSRECVHTILRLDDRHGFAVMIYNSCGIDDMHGFAVMIYNSCGIDDMHGFAVIL